MHRIHIIGIGGTFMGGLAALAKEAGFTVSGCDAAMYPPMSTQLAELGIAVHEGFDAEQLNHYPADTYIIGNVAKRTMPVVETILNRNLPYISGPQWLAENILHDRWVLAVAGTHGKTTTSSMLAWILEYAGLAPGFLIGGIPENFNRSARLPQSPTQDPVSQSPFFVIEADEYDTAFFDKRSKFVHYRPRTLILNNLEHDHADIFPDLAAIQTQFHHLVRTVPSEGLIICNGREENLKPVLAQGLWTPTDSFDSTEGWHLGTDSTDTIFSVCRNGITLGRIEWALSGRHNQLNALAALAAARHVGVSVQVACEALSKFLNVKRRMEHKGSVGGISVYDDFAHHPTAIAATLTGLRTRVGNKRILAVVEPRSNTMKMGVMKAALPDSLQQADAVFCYSGSISWNANDTLAPLTEKLYVRNDLDTLVGDIAAYARNGDHILIMSNGGFGGIHEKILNALTEKTVDSAYIGK